MGSKYGAITKYVDSIGRSVEGRDMPALHLTSGKTKSPLKIYFQCQIHAREWISGATCMFVVDYFVSKYGVDKYVTELLDSLEVIVVPFTNPDGYVWTWAPNGDRMWRKNRATNSGSGCQGLPL